jgi:hypothetical protein
LVRIDIPMSIRFYLFLFVNTCAASDTHMRLTRRRAGEARTRAVLVVVLVVLLPLAVLVVSGALANGRRWLSFLVCGVQLC